MNVQRAKLIFLHIPKTAGITLYRIIERQYHPHDIFTIEGLRNREDLEALFTMPPDERQRFACIMGHSPYGIHSYFTGPVQYMTMLRDPVDRIVSHYYYVKRSPENYLHDWMISNNIQLEDYVLSRRASELDNGQTRQLCGIRNMDAVFGHEPVTEEALELAKQHLADMSCVGLVEEFDKSLLMFQAILGWKRITYRSQNVNTGRPQRETISADVVAAIREVNKLDVALYEYGRGLFQERCQQHRIVDEDVTAFRHHNERYNRVYPLKVSLGKVKRLVAAAAIYASTFAGIDWLDVW